MELNLKNLTHARLVYNKKTLEILGHFKEWREANPNESLATASDYTTVNIGYSTTDYNHDKKARELLGLQSIHDSMKRRYLGIESGESIDDITLIDAFNAYHGIEADFAVIIQTDLNESMEFDGLEADSDWTRAYHESGMTLREFIESEFMP